MHWAAHLFQGTPGLRMISGRIAQQLIIAAHLVQQGEDVGHVVWNTI